MGSYKVPVRLENVAGTCSWMAYCLTCPQHRVIGSLELAEQANLDHVLSMHWELRKQAWDAIGARRRRAA